MATEEQVREALSAPRDAAQVKALLERALNYRQCVRVCHESLDVPDEIIATIAQVHPGSVRRWRSTDPEAGEPRQSQAQAIEWLRRIALVLVASGTFYDLNGVGVWLQAGREGLRWRAPYEVLAEGQEGFEAVLREAEEFVSPGAGLATAAAGFGPPSPATAASPRGRHRASTTRNY